jgi:hypothetical protein
MSTVLRKKLQLFLGGRKTVVMAGKHSDNTKLLGFFADLELVARVDQVRGAKARSQFMRDATVDYLLAQKVAVPEHLRNAPDRAGKGGPVKYRITRKKK